MNVTTKLESIEARLEEQKFYCKVLRLWDHLETTTGKTHKDVRSFTFRPEFLTPEEKKENDRARRKHLPPVYCDKNWHNCVRLKSGELMSMPGIARPIPPETMKSSIRATV